MIKILGTVIGIFSTATLLTLTGVLAYSWSEGDLNSESTREMIAILKGEPRPTTDTMEETEHLQTSYDVIERKRTEKILSLSARETELAVLKKAIDDQYLNVTSERTKLEQLKKTFREKLDEEYEKITSEATDQARGILLKMDPEYAVEKLLALEVSDAVLLLKGMNEKDAARILDQFRDGIGRNDPSERVEKAEEIYKAIYRGQPLIESVDEAQQALQG